MPTQPKFVTAPDIRKRILKALIIGCYRNEACAYARIDENTLGRWMDRGESHHARTNAYNVALSAWESGKKKGRKPNPPDPDEEIYAEFADRVKEAEARARFAAVKSVRSAINQKGGRGWVAAMTYLERKDPAKWGRRDRTTNVNLNLDASKMDLSSLSDAELAAFNAIVQKLSPQEESE